jgi:hypothetical protein
LRRGEADHVEDEVVHGFETKEEDLSAR